MREITLDYDIDYRMFGRSHVYFLLKRWVEENHDLVAKIYKRRSASRNTHVKILLRKPMSKLRFFEVRVLLNDDPNRVRLDMMRDYLKKPINRLWDQKYKKGVLKVAGDWVEICK